MMKMGNLWILGGILGGKRGEPDDDNNSMEPPIQCSVFSIQYSAEILNTEY